MKHEQVVVDYWTMAKTSCLFLLLALSGYVLLKMVQTIFWLPQHLQSNQKRLEELAAQYNVDISKEIEKANESEKLLPKRSDTGEIELSKLNAPEVGETETKKDL